MAVFLETNNLLSGQQFGFREDPLILIQMAIKKCVAARLGVVYDSPGEQEERGRVDIIQWP